MPSNESGAGATTSGGIRVQILLSSVGPAEQLPGFGYGLRILGSVNSIGRPY